MGPKNDEWDTKCTTHNKSTKKKHLREFAKLALNLFAKWVHEILRDEK